MAVFNNILAGAAGQSGGDAAGYTIQRSLRFNRADSANLSKNPSSEGNRRTWTWSSWVKRSDLASNLQGLFGAGVDNYDYTGIFFQDDELKIEDYPGGGIVRTQPVVLRDPSAWYHVVVAVDTTQSTAANRVKFYLNGVQLTTSGTWAQNTLTRFNKTQVHRLGKFYPSGGSNDHFTGYLADVNFIDGQQLAASDFGEFDADTGVWNPKRFSGTYGTNGFHLDFSDNSSDAALGTDSSGNGTNLPGVDFDGSGDHVESGDHADYSLGTNDFTIEAYIYPRTFADYKALMMKYAGSASNSSWWWSLSSSGHILFYLYYGSSEVGIVTSGTGMNLNAWNHVACVRDGNTSRVYINGVQVGTGNIGTNSINDSTTPVRIGEDSQGFYDFDGIMSNVRLVNGTCLYPNGTTFTVPSTPLTNVTNTKLLCCQSSSSATAAAVSPNTLTTSGDPFATSKNDSDWTVNNLSVASGIGNDSLLDSPTNYDDGTNIGANYATLNPLTGAQTLSNGNLDVTGGNSWQRSVSTIAMSSGQWYWEYEVTASNEHLVGVGPLDMQITGNLGAGSPPGSGYGTELGQVNGTGTNSSWTNTGQSNAGDVLGVAFDADAGKMYIYKNGTALNSGIPSHTGLTDGPYYAVFSLNGSSRSGTVNFGQRPFKYNNPGTNRPAATYLSLCTQSLDDPLIADPSTAFDVTLWTGNGGTQTISGLNHSPDLIWHKTRNVTGGSQLYDTLRGVSKRLRSDNSDSQGTVDGVTAFNSGGWTMTGGNNNNEPYVSWTWDASSSTTSLSAGGLNSSLYDQSQTWTNQVSGTQNSSYPFSNLFNGDNMATHAYPSNGTEAVFTPNPSFSNATTVKIWYYAPNMGPNGIKLNGVSVGNQLATTSGTLTKTFDVTGTGFTSLAWSKGVNNTDSGLLRIDVDGKQLVDSGVSVANVPSIATSYRANQNAGFSITTWTGTSNATVAHGLSKKPDLVITKSYSSSVAWRIWSSQLSTETNRYLGFDTNGETTFSGTYWGTMNSITLGMPGATYDNNTGSMVAYCFHNVDQYQQHGKYVGNGSADGPFIHLNFEPALVALKRIDGSGNDWCIYDATRSPFNAMDDKLKWNTSGAEIVEQPIDFLSNGFKPRNNLAGFNGSGFTYIYLAIARSAFKHARAV